MSAPRLVNGGKAALDALLRDKIAENSVPSIFWAVTNAQKTIYENQAGHAIMGDPSSGEVNRDSTLELYSMTKLIICVAILQVVDEGIFDLDDEHIVFNKLPELGTQMVIEGYDDQDRAILVPQQRRITLRMLMNHTSGKARIVPADTKGCTTPQRNAVLEKWYRAQPDPPPGGLKPGASIKSIICPLLFQPGSSFQYSSGTDWLGVLLTRISGLSLEDYLRQHIFSRVPGGMPDTTFYPRPDILERKAAIYQRLPDGSLSRYPGCSDGRADTVDKVSKTFLAGSGGLFGTTKDYLAFLRAILQCDPRNPAPSASPLLSSKSFELLFKPSLSAAQKGGAVELLTGLYTYSPQPTPETIDHSLGFALNLRDSDHGRKAGSGAWHGMARTQYWIDPSSGIAIIGKDPDPWIRIYTDFERAVYDSLQVERA